MNMARSTFYKRPNAEHAGGREKADADLRVRIEDILAEFPSYGYRRITHELRRRGQLVNHKRVSRVMREHALTPRRVRAWLATTNSKHKQPVYPNLRCSITPVGPDELWVADLTYIRLTTGFVFLAVVLDAWSRRVIGYASAISWTRASAWPRSTPRSIFGARGPASFTIPTAGFNTRLKHTAHGLLPTASEALCLGGEIPMTTPTWRASLRP